MKKTLGQKSMPASPRGLFKLRSVPVLLALLLVLSAGGLALWPRTSRLEAPRFVKQSDSLSFSRSLKEILAQLDIIPTHDHPLIGRPAPRFKLADMEGKVRDLTEFMDGHPALLIFYHGHHCASCMRQLFELNSDLPLFSEIGARVLAISADIPEVTRARFHRYGACRFPVLADPGKEVAESYGVFKRAQDTKGADILRHATFLLSADGTVQWANLGDAPLRRNAALLCQLNRMKRHHGDLIED